MLKLLSFSLVASQLASGFTLPKRQGNSTTSLHDLFVAQGKEYVGVCADQGTLSEGSNSDIITSTFGQVTAENSWKWDSTERTWFLLGVRSLVEVQIC